MGKKHANCTSEQLVHILFATPEKTDKIAQALRLKAKRKIFNACKVGRQTIMQRDRQRTM